LANFDKFTAIREKFQDIYKKEKEIA
jgi:hypothetical protein